MEIKAVLGKSFKMQEAEDVFGAASVSGMAAMKTGAGMLKICTHKENKDSVFLFARSQCSSVARGGQEQLQKNCQKVFNGQMSLELDRVLVLANRQKVCWIRCFPKEQNPLLLTQMP